jgi:sugar (pentulose or hexulose) kinase
MHHSKKKLISVGGGDGAAAAGSALARATTIGSNGAGTSITTPYLWGVDEEMLLPAS